jgi:hypothetical protein
MLSGSSEVKVAATPQITFTIDIINDSLFNQLEQKIKPLEHMFYYVELSKALKYRSLSNQ